MVSLNGHHDIIERNFRNEEEVSGELNGVRIRENGLTLGRQGVAFINRGVYLSEEIALPSSADELVMSWNCTAPLNTVIAIAFRVKAKDSEWSCWFQPGVWKSEVKQERRTEDPVYGKLDTDHFKATQMFDFVQFRTTLSTADPSQTPLLRRVAICVSNTALKDECELVELSIEPRDLPVPWLSQYDENTVKDRIMIAAGVCAATCVTMVLKYYELPANVRDVARRAYDPTAGIYGNWSFLAAAASEFGPDAQIERFNSWRGIEKLVEQGVPPIISIAYKKGTMSAEPEKETAGHLIVVRGFDEQGNVIVNDPDTLDEARGRRYVYPRGELAGAFLEHGGVSIVIRK